MSKIKKFGVYLLAELFAFSIFILVILFSLNYLIGTPNKIKNALDKEQTYTAIAKEAGSRVNEQSSKDNNSSINEDALSKAIVNVVTPELVKSNTDNVLDGTYGWLDGSTKTPVFEVNISEIRDNVITELSVTARNRVKGLQTCTAAELQTIDIVNIDPFTVPCNPPGYDVDLAIGQLENEISLTETDSLSEEVFTASNLKNDKGENIFKQASVIPKVFQLMQKLIYVFGFIIFLTALLIIFLNDSKLDGIKMISKKLVYAGIVLLIIFVAIKFLQDKGLEKINLESAELQSSVDALAKNLINVFNQPMLYFGAGYLVVGLVGWIGSKRFIKDKNQSANDSKVTNTEPVETKAEVKATKPQEPAIIPKVAESPTKSNTMKKPRPPLVQ